MPVCHTYDKSARSRNLRGLSKLWISVWGVEKRERGIPGGLMLEPPNLYSFSVSMVLSITCKNVRVRLCGKERNKAKRLAKGQYLTIIKRLGIQPF